MSQSINDNTVITPDDCLELLTPLTLDNPTEESGDLFRRADLRQSILNIADLNHVTESALVREVIKNALGELPGLT